MNDDNTNSREHGSGVKAREIDPEQIEGSEDNEGGGVKMLLAAAVMIGIVAVVYAGYRLRQRDDAASGAKSFASTFIHSSPVVQANLGRVENVKEIKEQHLTGQRPGWFLDYDVTGRRASGVVDMRLTPNPNFDSWNVAVAQLDVGKKSVALR